jgi:hypothetical protein
MGSGSYYTSHALRLGWGGGLAAHKDANQVSVGYLTFTGSREATKPKEGEDEKEAKKKEVQMWDWRSRNAFPQQPS